MEYDHLFLGDLTGDRETALLLSSDHDIKTMLRIETALAAAEGGLGVIPQEAAEEIADTLTGFTPDMEDLRRRTEADGVVVPGLVAQIRSAVGSTYGKYVHFGATSQDIIDTSLVLRVREILTIFDARLRKLAGFIGEIDGAGTTIMGKTRMQSALNITLKDRLRNWEEPLGMIRKSLPGVEKEVAKLQFAGPVGTLNALGGSGGAVRKALAERLELEDPEGPWHVRRLSLGRLAAFLSELTAVLGKIGTDILLMTQNETGTAVLKKGGSSSAMPHKNNPVDAEILCSFARYNAALLGGMHNALVHEQERSGVSWTLEWMILPGMLITAGAALRAALRLADAVYFPGP